MDPRRFRRRFLAGMRDALAVVWPIVSALLALVVGLGIAIGYGDLVPKTLLSRALATCIAFTGMLLTGLVAAIGVQVLTARRAEGDRRTVRRLPDRTALTCRRRTNWRIATLCPETPAMPTDTARSTARAEGAFRFHCLAKPAVVLTTALALHGCYPYPYYPPGAVSTPAVPASFENSWQAARGAAHDEGVNISFEDRASGVVRGTRGPFDVTINVAPQADGSVRVSFSTTGPTAQDPGLQERFTRAYNRRMGR